MWLLKTTYYIHPGNKRIAWKANFEDEFPFPKVGYVRSLEGSCHFQQLEQFAPHSSIPNLFIPVSSKLLRLYSTAAANTSWKINTFQGKSCLQWNSGTSSQTCAAHVTDWNGITSESQYLSIILNWHQNYWPKLWQMKPWRTPKHSNTRCCLSFHMFKGNGLREPRHERFSRLCNMLNFSFILPQSLHNPTHMYKAVELSSSI